MFKNLKLIGIFTFVILALSLSLVSATNTYYISLFSANETTSPLNVQSNSLFSNNFNCKYNLSLYQTMNGTNYDVNNVLYSPSGEQKAINSYTSSSYLNCAKIFTKTDLSNSSKIDTIYTAVFGNNSIESNFYCTSQNRYIELIGKRQEDSFGNQFNAYAKGVQNGFSSQSIIRNKIKNTNKCRSDLLPIKIINETGTVGTTQKSLEILTYFPFNSSNGNVDYFISGESDNDHNAVVYFSSYAINGYYANASLYLIDTEAETTSILWSEQNTCTIGQTCLINTNITGSLSLTRNRVYYFVYASRLYLPAGGSPVHYDLSQPVFYNITIDSYIPNISCSLSSCSIDNLKTQTCIDLNGIAPDEITIEYCEILPTTDVLLGFEDYYTDTVSNCDIEFLTCSASYSSRDILLPSGWLHSSPTHTNGVLKRNYMQIVDTTSTEGIRSLRMHYVPPKNLEPAGSGSPRCDNLTTGAFPEASTPYNESLFVAFNVSFANPFAQIRFDVRKCDENVVQYDHEDDFWFNFNCANAIASRGWKNKKCYARDCNTTVKGRYGIRLVDGSDIIVDYSDVASIGWERNNIIDLSNAGLVVGKNYTLGIAVNPENQLDADGYCVYFDNVRATFTDVALPDCVGGCEGLNLKVATSINETICVFKVIENSPDCAKTEDMSTKMENKESFCDNLTRYVYNNVTGIWNEFENSDLCLEEQQELTEQDELKQPAQGLEIISESLGEFNVFLSLFAIGMFVIVAGIVFTGMKTGDGMASLGVGLVLTILMVGIGFFPLEYGFLIGAGLGLMLAFMIKKGVGG